MANLVVMGDSITQGWDGKKQVENTIPKVLGRLAGFNEVSNLSVGGTTFTGSKGLPTQLQEVSFNDYGYVLIAFGTNDYWQSQTSLTDMRSSLQNAISAIKKQNSHAVIMLTTPIQGWENNARSLNDKNTMGVSQNDIDDMIVSVARFNGLRVNDWRNDPIVTSANYQQMLGDQMVHPTESTMALMAERYFKVFFDGQTVPEQDNNGHSSDHSQTDVQPSKPTDEQMKLKLITGVGDLISTSNANFEKVFKVLVYYSFNDDYSVSWQKQKLDLLNRQAYLYLIKTWELIKKSVDGFLGDQDIYDDDLEEVTDSAIVVPKILSIDDCIIISNDNFKKLQKIMDSIRTSNE